MSFLAAILLKNEHFFLLAIRHIAPAVFYCVLTKRQERAFVLIFHHYRTKFKHPLYQQSCTPANIKSPPAQLLRQATIMKIVKQNFYNNESSYHRVIIKFILAFTYPNVLHSGRKHLE